MGFRVAHHAACAAAAVALLSTLTGCGGKADARKQTTPPPSPKPVPESSVNSVPGAKSLQSSTGLRRTITYSDKISVGVTGIRYVKETQQGPGSIEGQVLTIFTLRFTNGSTAPLDLNQVKVTARYLDGKRRPEASPASVGNLNDFYGTVAPGQKRSASYAFAVPYPKGYKGVILGVKFDDKHRAAVFSGSLKQ